MKRLLTLILCLCLLLSSTASLAAGMSGSADRYNVSDTKAPNIIKFTFDEDGKTLKIVPFPETDNYRRLVAQNKSIYNKLYFQKKSEG